MAKHSSCGTCANDQPGDRVFKCQECQSLFCSSCVDAASELRCPGCGAYLGLNEHGFISPREAPGVVVQGLRATNLFRAIFSARPFRTG